MTKPVHVGTLIERLDFYAEDMDDDDKLPWHFFDDMRQSIAEIRNRDAEIERLRAREAELVGALGLYERVTTSHVDGRDLLEELQPSAWHHCDIVVRIGGKDCRFLGDWLKGVWYARKNARALTAARQEPS